jgi:hypothetical protein
MTFLKRTGLFYLYNTLAIFAGMLISSIPTIVLRAILHLDSSTFDSNLLSGIINLLCTMSVLAFLMHRDTYEKPQFSLKTEVLPAITVCIIRWAIWLITKGEAAFWVVGSAVHLRYLLFPHVNYNYFNGFTDEAIVSQLTCTIIFDFLITLPVFINSGYIGYKRRDVERKRMIREHEEAMQ